MVDRFAGDPAIELRPVFLVALPETASSGAPDAGYLVLGSTPDPDLAARYGASLGATHALTGVIHDLEGERSIEATLVAVAAGTVVARFSRPLPSGELPSAEPALAAWLVEQLGIQPAVDVRTPVANEPAYQALLEGLDEEVNATLLRPHDTARADEALARAVARYLAALAEDLGCAPAEERILVLAAESLERGDEDRWVGPLETLSTALPGSWRAHYLLGELRRHSGDAAGAIVALEHSDALHPLADADTVRLALLYRDQAAPRVAAARLRRVRPGSADYAAAQAALGTIAADAGDLAEAVAAGERAIAAGARDGALYAHLAEWYLASGDPSAAAAVFSRTDDATPAWELSLAHGVWLHQAADLDAAAARYREAIARGAPGVASLNLARALVSNGDSDGALATLDALLDVERSGEVAAHGRRLRFGLRAPALEHRLESAGRIAVGGDEAELPFAAGELAAIIATEPDLWEAQFGAGLVARRQGDAVSAEHAFRRVLELWPDQPDALHELGVALLMSDRTNEAVRTLETAARLRPEDAGYLADAGFAQLRAGNLHAARERLDRSNELTPNDPITRAYRDELARVEAAIGPRD